MALTAGALNRDHRERVARLFEDRRDEIAQAEFGEEIRVERIPSHRALIEYLIVVAYLAGALAQHRGKSRVDPGKMFAVPRARRRWQTHRLERDRPSRLLVDRFQGG